MKKGRKKWLIAALAAVAAILGVVQPQLAPVVDILGAVVLPVDPNPAEPSAS